MLISSVIADLGYVQAQACLASAVTSVEPAVNLCARVKQTGPLLPEGVP